VIKISNFLINNYISRNYYVFFFLFFFKLSLLPHVSKSKSKLHSKHCLIFYLYFQNKSNIISNYFFEVLNKYINIFICVNNLFFYYYKNWNNPRRCVCILSIYFYFYFLNSHAECESCELVERFNSLTYFSRLFSSVLIPFFTFQQIKLTSHNSISQLLL